MASHEYTPRDALRLLMDKMARISPELLGQMQGAIDVGKEVEVEEVVDQRRRFYRRNEPYTDQEAINVAITILESHLVETRKFIETADADFTSAGIAPPKKRQTSRTEKADTSDQNDIAQARVLPAGERKELVIEEEPETVLVKQNPPNLPLLAAANPRLPEFELLLQSLRKLTDFSN